MRKLRVSIYRCKTKNETMKGNFHKLTIGKNVLIDPRTMNEKDNSRYSLMKFEDAEGKEKILKIFYGRKKRRPPAREP
jgi:hypothetical protein